MTDEASKDAIAQAATLLAIQVGHYERKFGAMPVEESVALIETHSLTDEQAGWMADGLEHLAFAIATVTGEVDEPPRVQ